MLISKPYIRQTNYYETDQMGIIHHSNYIRWFEEARVHFLKEVGFTYEQSVSYGIDFAVLDVNCEYKSMVRFGDTVSIQVSLESFSKTRTKLNYLVTDIKTGEIRTIGSSGHCYYSAVLKRPVSLQKAIPELYEILLEYI